MSAQLPTVVYLPPVSDETFLRNATDLLGRLQAESGMRGLSLLASLIEIARGEAEDGLRTSRHVAAIEAKVTDEDDGAAEMAQRLAHRVQRIA
jgi:hypothetical protein